MDKASIKLAVKILKKLGKKDGTPRSKKVGLCQHFANKALFSLKDLPNYDNIVRKWQHFSGNLVFPIPHKCEKPHLAYLRLSDLWTGEYGEMRRKFARYLAREYQKML